MFKKGNPNHWTKLENREEIGRRISRSLLGHKPWNKDRRVDILCVNCKKSFSVIQKREKSAKYCSRFCKDQSQKGKLPDRLIPFKGKTAGWNKGKKRNWESPSQFQKGDNINEKHHLWRGENVSYAALHSWISRRLGKPRICEQCGTKTARSYEWANKDGEYTRNLNDYIRLCKPCHTKFDFNRKVEVEVIKRLNEHQQR